MSTRLLTVHKSGRAATPRPRISFFGDWLGDIGFVPNALVQAIPMQGGVDFTLCDENASTYSDLFFKARAMGGSLVRAYRSNTKGQKGTTFVASGHYIYIGGLAIGDSFIAKYDYGVIRVRKVNAGKLGFENAKAIVTTQIKDKYLDEPVPKVRICGDWLGDIGFTAGTLAIASSEQGVICLDAKNANTEYSALVKCARRRGLSIFQVYNATHNRKNPCPCIDITGSFVDRAGFRAGDMLVASYRTGAIKVQRLELEKLGF